MKRQDRGGARRVAAVLHKGKERLDQLGIVRLVVFPKCPDRRMAVVHKVDVVIADVEHFHVGVFAIAIHMGVFEDFGKGRAVANGGACLIEVRTHIGCLGKRVADTNEQIVRGSNAGKDRLVVGG